ncbi:Oidioi.mRNA.OKI2018_I69.PAR.g9880.t1.cds [Oikopleura dioica]|uniref:Oidioi.mRNA.OKI2018_I69.PAR.g9880.t1.cds n=1 Tax=Oikopleura dioica TaxID=34765 RepID=A0ABN7RRD2_OIKDI|nr:Oidioi.mRNA.OKI2018_I69.PAR.g9880.t1.cds [Oikopleura dioica]
MVLFHDLIEEAYLIFGPFFYIVCHISGLILELLPFSIQKPKGPLQEKLFLALFIVMYIINYYFCWALEFGEIRCEKIWAQMIFLQALVSLIPFTLLTVGSMVMVHLAHLANDDEMNTSNKIKSKKNISEDDQPLLSEHHVSEVVSE